MKLFFWCWLYRIKGLKSASGSLFLTHHSFVAPSPYQIIPGHRNAKPKNPPPNISQILIMLAFHLLESAGPDAVLQTYPKSLFEEC